MIDVLHVSSDSNNLGKEVFGSLDNYNLRDRSYVQRVLSSHKIIASGFWGDREE